MQHIIALLILTTVLCGLHSFASTPPADSSNSDAAKLKGLKPSIPVDENCREDWLTLTNNGARETDAKGYVKIVAGDYSVVPAEGIWVLFECTLPKSGTGKPGKGVLTLKHCRIGRNELLPAATCYRYVYPGSAPNSASLSRYYSCGSTQETTPAEVADKVTRTNQLKDARLKVLTSLDKI